MDSLFGPDSGLVLDEDQKTAASTPSDNTLIVARAGSGKTTVLIARTIFLQKIVGVHPDEILMLTFNKKAQQEIQQRLEEKSDGPYPFAKTFHSLAHNIVKPQQEILFDDEERNQNFLTREIARLENRNKKLTLVQAIVNLSKELLNRDNSEFHKKFYQIIEAKLNAISENIASGSLEVVNLDQEILRGSKLYDDSTSLDGTMVKSYGEKIIADALFVNNIEYEYEKIFYWNNEPYRPDFTIQYPGQEGGVVIEYFGMNDDAYQNQIVEKKAYWDTKENWNLVDVYPYQFASAEYPQFQRHFLQELESLGVPNRELTIDELIEKMPMELGPSRYTEPFKNFIIKCRINKWHPSELENDIKNIDTDDREVNLFLELALELYTEYLNEVIGPTYDDFPGILHRAAEKINDGQSECNFNRPRRTLRLEKLKHILIDEFQDFSPAFFDLIDAIRTINPDVKVFCVGDDWQAINGFMGADRHYLRDFNNHFPESRSLSMNTNYRSVSQIVDISNDFMRTFEDTRVLPRSYTATPGKAFLWISDKCFPSQKETIMLEGEPDIFLIILRIIQKKLDKNPESEIAVLCRTNNPIRGDEMTTFEFLKKLKRFIDPKYFDQVTVETVHSFKGKEADCIILANVENFYYPLIHPDIKFEEIFGVTETTTTAEERRLFYVALTRAKNSLHIIASSENKSDFLDGLSFEKMSFDDLDELRPVQSEIEIRIHEIPRRKNQVVKNAGFTWNETGKYWVNKYPENWWNGPSSVNGTDWIHVVIRFDVIEERTATVMFSSRYKRLCLTGETFDIKDDLKKARFRFDRETTEWYQNFPFSQSNKRLLETLERKPWYSEDINAEIRIV